MKRSIFALLAGYLMFGISAAALFALSGVDPKAVPSSGFAVGSVAYGIVFAFLGGWTAARIAGRKEVLHAGGVAAIIAAIALVSLFVQTGEGSVWSQVATIVLMAPSAVAGGAVRRRMAMRR